MSDYTDREIPVLDDIISSPIRTDELLADAKITDAPPIQANVQLDIELDEPSLMTDTTAALDELATATQNPFETKHSRSRIEPALHDTEDTVLPDITSEQKIDASENIHDFTYDSADTASNDITENLENTEQETLNEIYDDPDILPSGERLYRYIPDTPPEIAPAPSQATDTDNTDKRININISNEETPEDSAPENMHAEQSSTQGHSAILTDDNDLAFETDSEVNDTEQLDALNNVDHDLNEDETYSSSSQAEINEDKIHETDNEQHESALIDYQTDIDPYALNESNIDASDLNNQTSTIDKEGDDKLEISDFQAESNAEITGESLISSTLNQLDTDALTEQVLQKVLPNIEQHLRNHIKEALQKTLNQKL